MPRPTKLTPETQKRIVEALLTGATIEKVCAYVGVGTTTFYRWMEKGEVASRGSYREFWDAVTHAQASAHIKAVLTLRASMSETQSKTDTHDTAIETRLRTVKLADGTVEQVPYEHTKTRTRHSETTYPGDWRAAESFLKRRDAANWSATLNVNIDLKLVQDAIKALDRAGIDAQAFFQRAKERADKLASESDGHSTD